MRILLVEDDRMIGESVLAALRSEGYDADWVADGESAEAAAASVAYDLLVLDLGLPGQDGLALLRGLRARRQTLPVIITTARDGVSQRIAGLDAGADDYLLKPFDLDELLARIRAQLRRAAGTLEELFQHGAVTLNRSTREALVDGRPVQLTAREWAVLDALLARPGVILSRPQLEGKLYGWQENLASNAVEVFIHGLRRKLGPDLIQNVRGVGYLIPRN
jgi:two-component system OmpR family response regulator